MGEKNKFGIKVVKSLKLRKVTEVGHAESVIFIFLSFQNYV